MQMCDVVGLTRKILLTLSLVNLTFISRAIKNGICHKGFIWEALSSVNIYI